MLNVSIGAQIQTGLDRSRTRMTIENAFRFLYTSSTHACTQSGFILEDSTNSTTRRNRSPIYVYTRLVRQRHYFGKLWSKVQLLKKLEKSPEVQRLADMISTKNIIWHCQQRATFICRLYGDVTTTVTGRTVLRNRPLQTLVEACKRLEPEWLPSTNRAAHVHASSSSGELNPTEYGWENVAFEPSPIMRDLAIAPNCILQFKRCKTGLGVSVDPPRLL